MAKGKRINTDKKTTITTKSSTQQAKKTTTQQATNKPNTQQNKKSNTQQTTTKQNTQQAKETTTQQAATKSSTQQSKKTTTQQTKKANHQEKVLKRINEQIILSKKIPKEKLNDITRKAFPNAFIAAIIMFFLDLLLFGFININSDNYNFDLKVFSIIGVLLTIFIIENAYKKDKVTWVMYSIECLIMSFFVLSLTYINKYHVLIYQKYLAITLLSFIAYYAIKSYVILLLEVKKYRKSSSDIQKILK